MEVAAWSLGLVLMLTFAALRAWSGWQHQRAIEVFANARAQRTHLASASAITVDQSLWSPQRVAAFSASARYADAPIALLQIPALRLEVPVFEGTGEANLNRGAGRIEGTAPPGTSGNVGIAAHRDGFFRALKDVAVGQSLVLETPSRTMRYRIVEARVVEPTEISVLAPTPRPTVTLVTCYPFYFVGAAPDRFVVRAEAQEAGTLLSDDASRSHVPASSPARR
ncbi:MAG: class D sortase [Steroidobacteraceae bacterium]|jgi:sortase A|nr:class D sortase [Steroidobacteraceae bacterium]